MSRTIRGWTKAGALATMVIAAGSVIPTQISAQTSSDELRVQTDELLRGKKVGWVPVALGIPLTDIWTATLQTQFEQRGMELTVRDPNWNTSANVQAVQALVAEQPDVLVVHNPNVQLLARQLQRAQEAGIFVIQVNMASSFKTDAYVGANWYEIGQVVGREMVRECGKGSGQSGKVAIVQGELTSAASIEQLEGAMAAFAEDDTISVVSNQAANWDATNAFDITSTVLQQHPDLCATFGFWGVMQAGAAQAVKAAGLQDKVKVYASGADGNFDCEAVDNGLFHKFLSYDAASQAREIATVASFLLQSGMKPGDRKMAFFSTWQWLEKGKPFDRGVCTQLQK